MPLTLLAAALATALAHEAIHLAAARLLGVPGARLRFAPRITALIVDYDEMTPSQYFTVALAPQLLTPLLLAAASHLEGLPGLVLCVAGVVNLAGGAPDIVNALYFRLVHGDAQRFRPLYRWDGQIDGGIVEYKDKLIVYVI